jgi:predicted nucleic acid-binding protein
MKSLAGVRKMKRHFSACDALTVAVAKLKGYEILSGDLDLTVAARNEGVRVIW